MPAKIIYMHKKKYDLVDGQERNKVDAQQVAIEIRSLGKVAFLNPRKRKDKPTTYFVYEAPKAERKTKKPKTKIVVKDDELVPEIKEVEHEETEEQEPVFIESPIIKEISTLNEIENVVKKIGSNLKECKTCGKEFKPKNTRQVYCKKSCRPNKK